MNNLLLPTLLFLGVFGFAQQNNPNNVQQNTADRLLGDNNQLSIGGYGQIDYNQSFGNNTLYNGKLDVHRLVMMFGYKFSDNTKFITEIEFEHVSEVYVEQAFLQHRINDFINLRAGLMLIPMGIINEYHEPLLFNGVERPNVDNYIVPTTWREIGAGITGRIAPINIKYQAYVMNGFNGYSGSAKFNGENGLRKGRQKGAESFMSSPTFSTKLDYYGVRNLSLGLAYYGGKSQTSLYNGIEKTDGHAISRADSSVVGISMFGIDAIYSQEGFTLKGQFIINKNTNTAAYNQFGNTDMGSTLLGYYGEIGYNVFQKTKLKSQLIPFVRYEYYDTQHKIESDADVSFGKGKHEITAGIGWKITPGSVIKADYQHIKAANGTGDALHVFNMGVGVWF